MPCESLGRIGKEAPRMRDDEMGGRKEARIQYHGAKLHRVVAVTQMQLRLLYSTVDSMARDLTFNSGFVSPWL